MTRKFTTFVTAALFAASTAAFAADKNNASNAGDNGKGSNGQAQSQQSQDNQQTQRQQQEGGKNAAPQGFALLEENTVFMMAREPQQHLLRAHEQLTANNPKAAAAELRLAGAYLKMQEARPGDQGMEVLGHWQKELHDLAGQVQKGDAKIADVTRASAGANYALAKYFDERARGELGDASKHYRPATTCRPPRIALSSR